MQSGRTNLSDVLWMWNLGGEAQYYFRPDMAIQGGVRYSWMANRGSIYKADYPVTQSFSAVSFYFGAQYSFRLARDR